MHVWLRVLQKHHRLAERLLFALLIFVSLSLAITGGNQLRYPDEYDYHQLALSILEGDGYSNEYGEPTAYRPPGWPFLLSLVYRILPQPVMGKLLNALFFVGSVWLVGKLAEMHVGKGTRIWVFVLALLYPLFIYTAGTLYPQTAGGFFLVATLVLISKTTWWRYAIAGLLYGFLILAVPAFLLVLPLIFLCIAIMGPSSNGILLLKRAVLFILCATVVITPWSVRNSLLFERFVLLSTNSGVNFLLGNSENTTPQSGVNADISHYMERTEGMNEVERDARLRSYALEWIQSNPLEASLLYARKVLAYFSFRNVLYVESEQSSLRDAVLFMSYYPLLLLALCGLVFFGRFAFSRGVLAGYILYVGNAFVSAIFFTRIRFRVPFDLILIFLAAAFLAKLCVWLRGRIHRVCV